MNIIEKKNERIKFWMTDKELKQIERKAQKLNMNRSEYIRRLIENAAFIRTPDINYKQYYTEFKKLSDEFNRYVRALNITGIFNEKKANIVCEKISSLLQQLYDEITQKLDAEITKAKGGIT